MLERLKTLGKCLLGQPGVWLYLVSIFLISSFFLPNLREINLWDEASYVYSGYKLWQGQLTNFAFSPLSSILYALTYLPYANSPYWLVQSDSLARLVIYSLMFLSCYLIGRQLSRYFHPLVMLGFFLVTPVIVSMFNFPSDPLFSAFSGLAFWQTLAFYDSRQVHYLWKASALLGLAALARNDGLVIFIGLLAAAFFLSGPTFKVRLRALLPASIPFIALVGGYLLIQGFVTGSFSPGTLERAYDNFESGQEGVYSQADRFSPTIEAYLEARRVFGTPEENQYMVLNAIRHNPQAYFLRFKSMLVSLPEKINNAYGIKFTVVLVLLAVRGVVEILWRKETGLALISLLWFLPMATGVFNTMIREGYLRLPYFVVFALAAVGLGAILTNLDSLREKMAWLVVLSAVIIASLATNKLAVYYGAAVFLAALTIIALTNWRFPQVKAQPAPILLLVLMCAGLVLTGQLPSPKLRTLGVDADEQASAFMHSNLPKDSLVLSGSPAAVWMAKMKFAGLNATDIPEFKDSDEFADWMIVQDVKAVYVDHTITPYFLTLLYDQMGNHLIQGYLGEEGDYQVLWVKP